MDSFAIARTLRRLTPRWIRERVPRSVRRRLRLALTPYVPFEAVDGPFSEVATEADVYYCYRLLLQRAPDPDGWKTYEAAVRAGTATVQALVADFLASPEFRRRARAPGDDPSGPVLVEADRFRIYVLPDDPDVGQALLTRRVHEPHVTAALRRLLRPGGVFVDVGAHVGYFSLVAAVEVGGTGRVIAFDPVSTHCALLLASALLNGLTHVTVHPVALAARRGVVALQGRGSHTRIADDDEAGPVRAGGTLAVGMPLDEMLAGVERVDVIKIDAEGAEARVLEGAARTIARHRPVILSEFFPTALAQVSGVSGERYLETLAGAGYTLSVIGQEGRLSPCGTDARPVMEALARHPSTHIDLVATPR